MHTIHRFLLFCVVSGHVFSVQDISPLIDCLTDCVNETCQEACNDYISEIDLYSQIDEDTTANTSLHCIGENLMMIAFNPGMYIIEQSVSEYAWISAKAIKASLATFTNLTADTVYRFRFYKITKDGILHPETSSSFSTYKANYVPQSVKNTSLLKLEVDEKNECNLRAEVDFEPAEDRSCNYNVLVWDGGHELRQFALNRISHFQFELKDLMFGQNNTVSIFSVNNDKTSPQISIIIHTPTCLKYYNNLTICAPEEVKGLQVTHVYNGQLYNLDVRWNKPAHEPFNYTVQIDLGEDHDLLVKYIHGDKTEASFLNLELGSQYEVSIVADSLGGTSLPTSIIKNLIVEHARYLSLDKFIIGISICVIIVILVAMIYFPYYKPKSKHFAVECAHFETHDPMDSLIETTTKLPFKDYKTEMNNTPLIHDKFELCPKLLKLKGILGSGAHGIVRLGLLEDKFGNVTEVAVKMLKENPSVEDIQNLHKEILIMKYAGQHSNIVSLIGCCVLHNEPVLVVEYCNKGDLQTYLRTIWQNMVNVAFNYKVRFIYEADSVTNNGIQYLSHTPGGKEQSDQNVHIITNRLYDIQQDVAQCTETVTAIDLLNYMRQIATGMEFLSSNRIIHRDLAARNILICADGIVKISDFGLSRDVYQESMYRKEGNGKLPLKWMAIESLTHQLYTIHSDVWSFGILLWEIVTMGAVPYPGISTDAILKLLKSGYRMERPLSCGVELYDIMLSCWNLRPQSRPTFGQLKESVDKLLSCYSDNKYLNINEIIYNDQDQYRVLE